MNRQLLQLANNLLHHLKEVVFCLSAFEIAALHNICCKKHSVAEVNQGEHLRVFQGIYSKLANSLSITKRILLAEIKFLGLMLESMVCHLLVQFREEVIFPPKAL